jgi:hypothetical protein
MYHHPDYGCEQHFHHSPHCGWHHHWGCCCGAGYVPRRFPTREEIIEEMEEYLKQLKAEAKGIEERLAELRKES